jgi:glutathione S-transferase
MAAINPKGLVPAVTYKGRALYESLVLSEFFDDAFPSSGTQLLPSDPIERAYARIWIDYVCKAYMPAYYRLMTAQTKEEQDKARKEVVESLKPFADEIKGPFFLGDQFSLVDVVIAPWISRDYVLREHRGYDRKDVGPKFEQYAELVENRPSILKTASVSSKLFSGHTSHNSNLACRRGSTLTLSTADTCAMRPRVKRPKPPELAAPFLRCRGAIGSEVFYLRPCSIHYNSLYPKSIARWPSSARSRGIEVIS